MFIIFVVFSPAGIVIGFYVECAFESTTPGSYAAPDTIKEKPVKQFSKSVIRSSVWNVISFMFYYANTAWRR